MDKSVGERIPLIKQTTYVKMCNLVYVTSLLGYY